jgi:glycosyltransferase involved in cell wall biosynthesis
MNYNSAKPLISIITVVYNAEATIEETILSIISQKNAHFEYLIIDGGSTDGTLKIIDKYIKHVSFFVSEPDKGIYDAMNKGVSFANGNYIYFIGADDILSNNILKAVSSYLKKEKVIYGNVFFKNRKTIYDGNFSQYKIVTRNICHQAIFYPRKVFTQNNYNTKYKIFADYDLNLKLFNSSIFKFEYVPLTIAIFNDFGTSGLNGVDHIFERDRLKIIRKYFPIWIYYYRLLRTVVSKLIS